MDCQDLLEHLDEMNGENSTEGKQGAPRPMGSKELTGRNGSVGPPREKVGLLDIMDI